MARTIRDRVAVIGTGMTKFGEHWGVGPAEMIAEAVFEACGEANVDLHTEVDAGWVGIYYDFTGPSANGLADPVSFYGKPVTRVENYCCTGMDAVRNAALAIASGVYDIVIAVGAEKLTETGGTGLKVDNLYPSVNLVAQSAPGIFAPGAQRAMKEFGWTEEDFARVAVKNHRHGAHHPKAHFRKEISLEIAMNAPMICDPLRVFDCCAISDGAAALILTTPEIARNKVGSGNFATIKAVAQAVDRRYPFTNPDFTGLSVTATRQAAAQAYRMAGISDPLRDLDFATVHDCFTFAEMLHYQDIGLCKTGESHELIRAGVTSIEGAFPVNPEGGLKSFGHPIGATGVRMVAEATRQVLGRAEGLQVNGAKAGLCLNLGGPLSVCNITIVGTPDWEPGV